MVVGRVEVEGVPAVVIALSQENLRRLAVDGSPIVIDKKHPAIALLGAGLILVPCETEEDFVKALNTGKVKIDVRKPE